MGNVETFRSKAMKTYLVVSYVIVSCIFFSPGNLFADEYTERALAAENKMLRAAIDNLKAEIAKLKTEIKQLKEPPKQSKPVDSNSSKVVASPSTKPQSLEGNDILAKALLNYVQANKTTTAKDQEAYRVFCKESSVSVTIDFIVSDISRMGKNVAVVSVGRGIVKTSVITKYPIVINVRHTLDIKMSNDMASQIEKGNEFIMTGVYEVVRIDNGRFRADNKRVSADNKGFSTPLDYLQLEYNKLLMTVAIKNYVITLNGQRIELIKH